MALLFSNVAQQYANKMHEEEKEKEQEQLTEDTNVLSNRVSALFEDLDAPDEEDDDIYDVVRTTDGVLPQRAFMSSVANEYYKKSIEDINNTKIGNKCVRKKNFQQVMKESFFYGANRFGNNFIA